MLTDETIQGEDALLACLMEVERHIAADDWEQPPRLFALVPTRELEAAEPDLVASGDARDDHAVDAPPRAEDHLSAVEQDGFDAQADLVGALAHIMWPDAVVGSAVSLVRSFLPPGAEADIPDDPAAAEAYVQAHPQRQDVRAVVGVLRSGATQTVARLASHPEDLLSGAEMMPGVVQALAHTLEPADGDQLG